MRRVKTSLRPKLLTPKPRITKPARSSSKPTLAKKSSLPSLSKAIEIKRGIPKSDGERLASCIVKYTVPRRFDKRDNIKISPLFSQVSPGEISMLFLRKCYACCAFPDFSNPAADRDLKAIKLDLLTEIQGAVSNASYGKLLGFDCWNGLFRLLACNLLRKMPSMPFALNPEAYVDNEYSHIQVCYAILLELLSLQVVSKQSLSSFLSPSFVCMLFENITVHDLREQRDVVGVSLAIIKGFPEMKIVS